MAEKKRRKGRAGVESKRAASLGALENGLRQAGDWYHWGPYLSERQWGTVREDYSAGGTAWEYLPARPRPLARVPVGRGRARRLLATSSSGSASALALWNGRDPILKERIFGLTGNQGNHGEDAKEYWWYLDALPSHAWNRWRYHYPQAAFPYERPRRRERPPRQARSGVRAARHRRLRRRPLLDRRGRLREGATRTTSCMTVRVTNAGPETDTLHVLPTAWYRNTWAWDEDAEKPELRAGGDARVVTEHPFLGALELVAARSGRRARRPLLRQRDERRSGCSASPPPSRVRRRTGSTTTSSRAPPPSPPSAGTKAAFWYRARRSHRARPRRCGVRLRPAGAAGDPVGRLRRRRRRRASREADEFYAELTPAGDVRRRGARAAPGARRDALEQAALLLRRRALARRRPDAADAAGVAPRRAQRALEDLRRLRHHVDARQVGVPVVRRVGPRVPLRRARARRPGLREVPADPALPRVVPAPERRARRRTSGRSTTSTRRCRPGRRSRCSRSTAAATSSS